MTQPEDKPARMPGIMEQTVETDLARMSKLDHGVRGTLAQMARTMAHAIDGFANVETHTPAQLSALAKAHQELRTILSKLEEEIGEENEEEGKRMSTPVWDGAESGASDVGPSGGGGVGTAG